MRTKIYAHQFKTREGYFYQIYADGKPLDFQHDNFFETKKAAHDTIRVLYHDRVWDLKKEKKGFSISID